MRFYSASDFRDAVGFSVGLVFLGFRSARNKFGFDCCIVTRVRADHQRTEEKKGKRVVN